MTKHFERIGNGRVIVLLLLVVVALGFKIGWFWAGLMCAALLLAFQDGYDAGVEAGRSEASDESTGVDPQSQQGGRPAAGTG
jgi:hypothetical protein